MMKTMTYGLALGLATVMTLGGCQREAMRADAQPDFRMTASHRSVLAGETVTFTTSSTNTLGRSPEIQWHSSGGEDIRTSADNRVAQITFNDPGTHTVSADLLLDGARARTQSATVEVRPLSTQPGQQQLHRDLDDQDQQQDMQ
jgi:plastocyanin